MSAAEHHEPTAPDLMFAALRHLEKQMHRVAPGPFKHALKDMPAQGVADASAMFCDAIRACVREETDHHGDANLALEERVALLEDQLAAVIKAGGR